MFTQEMLPTRNDKTDKLVITANALRMKELPENRVYYFAHDENSNVISSGDYTDFEEPNLKQTESSIYNTNFEDNIKYVQSMPLEQRISKELLSTYQLHVANKLDSEVDLLVSFVPAYKTPIYPKFDYKESKSSVSNLETRDKVQKLDKVMSSLRRGDVQRRLDSITQESTVPIKFGEPVFNELASFAMIQTSIHIIPTLLSRADVEHVDIWEQNPLDPTLDYIYHARQQINSDRYFSLPTSNNWIGLLDSGVTINHDLLSPYVVFTRKDCINGVSNYCTRDINDETTLLDPDDSNPTDHGSSSASILAGNNSLGSISRGVTHAAVDSFRMSNNGFANQAATLRAFIAARYEGDSVILAEMQFNGNEHHAVSIAADEAFDSGIAIVAPAGNFGADGPGSIRSPGVAHKVLAVGAYDVNAPHNMMPYSSQGPASDGRIKPDFSAPTNTRAAKPRLGSTSLGVFTGTSGSSPYGAAAASLMHSFIFNGSGIPPLQG